MAVNDMNGRIGREIAKYLSIHLDTRRSLNVVCANMNITSFSNCIPHQAVKVKVKTYEQGVLCSDVSCSSRARPLLGIIWPS